MRPHACHARRVPAHIASRAIQNPKSHTMGPTPCACLGSLQSTSSGRDTQARRRGPGRSEGEWTLNALREMNHDRHALGHFSSAPGRIRIITSHLSTSSRLAPTHLCSTRPTQVPFPPCLCCIALRCLASTPQMPRLASLRASGPMHHASEHTSNPPQSRSPRPTQCTLCYIRTVRL